MKNERGYFCRSFVGRNLQSNVAVRTLEQAETELTRMITAGATFAHAIEHGKSDREPELIAERDPHATPQNRTGVLRRFLHAKEGLEFDRWQDAFRSDSRLLDDRWVVVALSPAGIHEYGAFGKAIPASESRRSQPPSNA